MVVTLYLEGSTIPWSLPSCPSCWHVISSGSFNGCSEPYYIEDRYLGFIECKYCGYKVFFEADQALTNDKALRWSLVKERTPKPRTDAGSVLKRLCKPYERKYVTPFFGH